MTTLLPSSILQLCDQASDIVQIANGQFYSQSLYYTFFAFTLLQFLIDILMIAHQYSKTEQCQRQMQKVIEFFSDQSWFSCICLLPINLFTIIVFIVNFFFQSLWRSCFIYLKLNVFLAELECTREFVVEYIMCLQPQRQLSNRDVEKGAVLQKERLDSLNHIFQLLETSLEGVMHLILYIINGILMKDKLSQSDVICASISLLNIFYFVHITIFNINEIKWKWNEDVPELQTRDKVNSFFISSDLKDLFYWLFCYVDVKQQIRLIIQLILLLLFNVGLAIQNNKQYNELKKFGDKLASQYKNKEISQIKYYLQIQSDIDIYLEFMLYQSITQLLMVLCLFAAIFVIKENWAKQIIFTSTFFVLVFEVVGFLSFRSFSFAIEVEEYINKRFSSIILSLQIFQIIYIYITSFIASKMEKEEEEQKRNY